MQLDVTYRVTTPLFLAGANEEEAAELRLRPPSFKGLLRFWFRAVSLPRLGSWQAVSKIEKDLFGSTLSQAAFHLSLERRGEPSLVKPGKKWEKQDGINYLGYGVINKGQTVRAYLSEGFCFSLRLITHKDLPKEQADFLVLAVKAMGLFGGAGARARKGFGSLSLEAVQLDGRDEWIVPADVGGLRDNIREFLKELKIAKDGVLPPYTAFSSFTKVSILQTGADPCRLVNDVGKELLRYRSYGSKDQRPYHALPWGEHAEQLFAEDHDLMADFIQRRPVSRHPRRIVFGLPHNYFFLSSKQKAGVEGANSKRRASPLFIHIHGLNSGSYAAVLTFMPAVFLPEGEQIKLSTGKRSVEVACKIDFKTVEAFFERPAFRDKVVVWP